MRSEAWLRSMSALVLVGLFAAGTLFGAGLMKWTAPAADRLPPPPRRGTPIEAMKRELVLTDAQLKKAIAIVEAHRPDLEAIARRTQHEVRDVMFAIEDELVPELDAKQKQMLEEWRARRPPAPPPPLPGGGPPPPPPGGGPPPPRPGAPSGGGPQLH